MTGADTLIAGLLGVLEGLTEFIPVSSTGHLLLAGHFLGFESAGRTFEVVIQLGAILALLSVYAARLADLFLNEVDSRDHFADRVLNLDARIHFDEIKLAVFIEKFKGAGAAIADSPAGFGAAIANAFDQAVADSRSRGFFKNFLVAALHRAITFAKINGVFAVREYLNFHVTRILQVFLHVDFRITEKAQRF